MHGKMRRRAADRQTTNYTTPSLTSTRYYRVVVSATGNGCTTATSSSVEVTVSDDDDPVPNLCRIGQPGGETRTTLHLCAPEHSWNGTASDNCSAAGDIAISYQLFGSTTGTTGNAERTSL